MIQMLKMKSSLILRMRSSLVVRPSDCHNAPVARVLGSIPASVDTVESEGRQIKQCEYSTKQKIPPPNNMRKKCLKNPRLDLHLLANLAIFSCGFISCFCPYRIQ
jgi:hypothetical protein